MPTNLVPIVSTAYAIHAASADTATYAHASSSVDDNDWTIDGTDIYHETGNVGIGTTSPSEILSVGDDLTAFSGNMITVGDADPTEYAGISLGPEPHSISRPPCAPMKQCRFPPATKAEPILERWSRSSSTRPTVDSLMLSRSSPFPETQSNKTRGTTSQHIFTSTVRLHETVLSTAKQQISPYHYYPSLTRLGNSARGRYLLHSHGAGGGPSWNM